MLKRRLFVIMGVCLLCFASCATKQGGNNNVRPTVSRNDLTQTEIESIESVTKENEDDNSKIESAVLIEQIEWSVSDGTIGGDNYVLGKIKNNSQYTLKSVEVSFTEKMGVTKEEKNAFYSDIQKSQNFDDEFMEKYIESREELSQPITMYFKMKDEIKIGEIVDSIKCYYLGGWTSKNVIYPELFLPQSITFEYEDQGEVYKFKYDFSTKQYTLK